MRDETQCCTSKLISDPALPWTKGQVDQHECPEAINKQGQDIGQGLAPTTSRSKTVGRVVDHSPNSAGDSDTSDEQEDVGDRLSSQARHTEESQESRHADSLKDSCTKGRSVNQRAVATLIRNHGKCVRAPNGSRFSCGRDGAWRTVRLSASSIAPWRTNRTLSGAC